MPCRITGAGNRVGAPFNRGVSFKPKPPTAPLAPRTFPLCHQPPPRGVVDGIVFIILILEPLPLLAGAIPFRRAINVATATVPAGAHSRGTSMVKHAHKNPHQQNYQLRVGTFRQSRSGRTSSVSFKGRPQAHPPQRSSRGSRTLKPKGYRILNPTRFPFRQRAKTGLPPPPNKVFTYNNTLI